MCRRGDAVAPTLFRGCAELCHGASSAQGSKGLTARPIGEPDESALGTRLDDLSCNRIATQRRRSEFERSTRNQE